MAHCTLQPAGAGRIRYAGALTLTLALAIGVAGVTGSATAQQPTQAPKKAPEKSPPRKAAPAPAQKGGQPSAWVKLCRKAPFVRQGADGKPISEEREVCSTQQEQRTIDGQVRISSSLIQVQGADKMHLNFVVPSGVVLPPGLGYAILSKDEAGAVIEKMNKGEALEDGKMTFQRVAYLTCHQGCSAELDATAEIISKMRAGGGILVRVVAPTGQGTAMYLPLQGFSEALDGKPYDNAKYLEGLQEQTKQVRASRYEEMLRRDPEFAALVKQQAEAQKNLEEQQKRNLSQDPKLAEAIKQMQEVQSKLLEHARSKQQQPAVSAPPKK
jgi:invasion protein IalB